MVIAVMSPLHLATVSPYHPRVQIIPLSTNDVVP